MECMKFSFKPFQYLASKLDEISGKIAWIDADTIQEINKNNIEKFLPKNDELMTYLEEFFPASYPHSETGFIGFNYFMNNFLHLLRRQFLFILQVKFSL